jgi:hypothetical protein
MMSAKDNLEPAIPRHAPQITIPLGRSTPFLTDASTFSKRLASPEA